MCLVLYKANLKLYWYTLINPKLGFLQFGCKLGNTPPPKQANLARTRSDAL